METYLPQADEGIDKFRSEETISVAKKIFHVRCWIEGRGDDEKVGHIRKRKDSFTLHSFSVYMSTQMEFIGAWIHLFIRDDTAKIHYL